MDPDNKMCLQSIYDRVIWEAGSISESGILDAPRIEAIRELLKSAKLVSEIMQDMERSSTIRECLEIIKVMVPAVAPRSPENGRRGASD